MSTPDYILDQPLPLSQDFKSLKKEGLAYIQQYGGYEWTNLNASDPGVTILDQLCYALTELGYCNDFSVADILTRRDGKLAMKDQFYLPEYILTTSPVTIRDYRKYLIDGVSGVKNVILYPATDSISPADQVYRVSLLTEVQVSSADKVCEAAFYYLNRCRNLGETFKWPVALQALTYFITGRIEIEKETARENILGQIQSRIRDFIFPEVAATGYDQLMEDGTPINEIFNGPLLPHGWIPGSALGEKRNKLRIMDVARLIGEVPGVSSVSGLQFRGTAPAGNEISSGSNELLVIDLLHAVNEGLDIYCKGRKLAGDSVLKPDPGSGKYRAPAAGIIASAPANVYSKLPTGKFREVNTYYSIQNTFPEIFAVGTGVVSANASDFQIAQSRQLKGYLTLFDQVLANQFSQLANIDRLFSFKNALTGAPADEQEFYAVKDDQERQHLEYPAPYLTFSPTYFYQSLYEVPHIRPLLKASDTFKFSSRIESEQVLEQKSWEAYKQDPYNPYMSGLMAFVEEERNSLERRNDILDHLLARHGEAPLVINQVIDGSVYTGDSLKDQVVFKSLYLQNLGLLSYYRQKAYNYTAANKIANILPQQVPVNFEEKILGGDIRDFIFDSEKIDRAEKLTEQDFINFSALELKLSLLFGLKVPYRNFIADKYEDPESSDDILVAFWLIRERRGLILLETNLLLTFAGPECLVIPNRIELVFPSFIPQFNTPGFQSRLEIFLQSTLSVQTAYQCHFVNRDDFKKLIPAFADFHNDLIYSPKTKPEVPLKSAAMLAALINELNRDGHA